ncbi:MAG: PTS transporter subunit EIIC [Bacillota bacterium]|nr:PTS transporter subunit EIIC [Bacillota bacterium]
MKNKGSLFEKFQKLGKVLMTPVMILPIVGILMGVGSAFTSANIVQSFSFLQIEVVQLFFKILKAMGTTVLNNLAIIFAVSVAVGYAKKEKGIAALSAMIGFLTMHNVMSTILIGLGKLDPSALKTGQSLVLGIPSLDAGVFGGILVGLLVAYLHNKYYKIQLPPIFSIFSGTKFIPVITIISSAVLGLFMSFVWPLFQNVLSYMGQIIYNSGAAGSLIYGVSERALLPFGLHHFIYLPFFFTNLGGSMVIDGTLYEGAVNIYNAMLAAKDVMFDVNITRFIMNGKVVMAMFGLPGAALAMYHCAKADKKKATKTLLIAAIIPCFFTGITEPIEFAFLFVAPILFVVHAGFSGLAYLLTYLFNVNVPGPSSFGGPFLSTIFNGIMQAGKGSNWIWIPILGVFFFAMYYFTFRFLIQKFDLKTPGREDEDTQNYDDVIKTDDIISEIIAGLGGQDNILSVDACFTRLRVKVKEKELVLDDRGWKALGASGVVRVQDGVQVIYGAKADVYKSQIREVLAMD